MEVEGEKGELVREWTRSGERSGWFLRYVVRWVLREWMEMMSVSRIPFSRSLSIHSGGMPVRLSKHKDQGRQYRQTGKDARFVDV